MLAALDVLHLAVPVGGGRRSFGLSLPPQPDEEGRVLNGYSHGYPQLAGYGQDPVFFPLPDPSVLFIRVLLVSSIAQEWLQNGYKS